MPRKKLTEEEEIARVKAMYEYEHNCRDNGYTVVAGVDEAGRGPLAGPVYAAAVILPNDIIIKGINDSKKLSEKKREKLFEEKLMAEEGIMRTDNELIHIGKPIPFDTEVFFEQLKKLADTCYNNSDHIVELVEQIVTTFHPVGEHPTGEENKKRQE